MLQYIQGVSTLQRYRPEIDGMRCLAVLSVMIYHLHGEWIPGGFTGVDVFFVISGFVVTGSLGASSAQSLPRFIAEFYARRLARIIPALVAMLVIAATLATMFIPPAWLSYLSEATVKYAFFGLSNWRLMLNADTYFEPKAEFNPYLHTWSLGVEEQYYVIAPFVLFGALRGLNCFVSIGRKVFLSIFALGTLASLLLAVTFTASRPESSFYFIGTRFWELGAGALLFLLQPTWGKTIGGKAWAREAVGWVGMLCVVTGLVLANPAAFPWPWAVLPVIGTMLIIADDAEMPMSLVRKFLSSAPFLWVGKRSYSLYLWHWPIYVLFRWTLGLQTLLTYCVALALTFLLGEISYRWIERPLRHNAVIERWPVGWRLAGFMALPVVGLLMVNALFIHRADITLSTVAQNINDWYPSEDLGDFRLNDQVCKIENTITAKMGGYDREYLPIECQHPLQAGRVYVLGNSHALHLSPMFQQIASEQGWSVTLFSKTNCSYLNLYEPMSIMKDTSCLAFNQATTNYILSNAQPGDVVVLSSLYLFRYQNEWGEDFDPDMLAHMRRPEVVAQRLAAFSDAKIWLRRFAEHRINVVFVAPPPIFKAPLFRCADWFNAMNPICVGQNRQPRAELEAIRAPIVKEMVDFAQEFPNVKIWDPFPILCPGETCFALRNTRPLFFDGDHLSGYGNQVLYPSFATLMQAYTTH